MGGWYSYTSEFKLRIKTKIDILEFSHNPRVVRQCAFHQVFAG